MSKLKDIARDVLAGKLQLSSKELAEERMKVCRGCPAFKKLTRQCSLCGCQLDLKVKVLRAECPIGMW